MLDDAELLCRYAEEGSAEAFDALARRHLDLIYSAALRQTGGETHLAKDVTQMVLIDLARKAGSLRGRASLVGWLHTATRYAVLTITRGERNRRNWETAAAVAHAASADEGGHDAEWAAMRPVLDAALAELKEGEREAVLLRFFKGCSYADIGRTLAMTETAARSRVDRALERLRVALSRRGVESTSAALATAMVRGATTAMPAEFAAGVIGAAVAAGVGGAATGAGALLWGGKGAAVFAELFALKFSTGVLILSLAANLTFGAVYYAHTHRPSRYYARFADISMAPVPQAASAIPAATSGSASRDFFAAEPEPKLDLTDQATLIRKMEEDGFDREDIARGIRGLHVHWSRSWVREVDEAEWATMRRWRLVITRSSENEARFAERDRNAKAAVTAAGYGTEPKIDFPYLSRAKAAKVELIVKDYAELSGSPDPRSISWVGPGRKGEAIWPEFEKDVRAALTAEEAMQFLRAHSPAARQVDKVVREHPQLGVTPETSGRIVDDMIAGSAAPAAFRRHLGDQRLLTVAEKLDSRAASADEAYRAAGLSAERRADLFVQGAALVGELTAASEAARPAIARRVHDTLVGAAALEGAQLDAFHATRLGRSLVELAAGQKPTIR